MIYPAAIDSIMSDSVRKQVTGTMEGLRLDRMSFWTHWSNLAEMFLPRRYKWFITPNQNNRGSQLNSQIVDETGVLSARILSSGMMSALTNPTKTWFELGLHDLELVEYGPVKSWLDEVGRRMMRVLAESNFYTSLGTLYHDLGVFGSASMIIYDDDEQVIRCYNPCLGEFFFGVSDRQEVDQHYREFTLTVNQTVQQFGLANVSDSVKNSYMAGGANRTREIVICHAIEPNTQLWQDATRPLGYIVPKKFKYREVYWEQSQNSAYLLQCAGYNEKPFVGARWDVVSNDAYGRCPGMDAMPAVRQLQIEQRRKAEAIDKLVRPPMVASNSMRNEPNSILPGSINYAADLQGAGFKPAYQVDPRLSEMLEDIQAVQQRVKEIFFVDLFMMISNLDTVRTATEIDARREEKIIQLGPVVERFNVEVLDVIIDRVFAIMSRRGLFPPPPPEISGADINIQYTSMFAEAQRVSETAGIERLLALAGNLMGVRPDAMDSINVDGSLEVYAEALSINPRAINSASAIAAIRQQRAQQQAQEQATQQSLAGVQGAKLLSETDVGGGQNALSAMVNGR